MESVVFTRGKCRKAPCENSDQLNLLIPYASSYCWIMLLLAPLIHL